MEASAQAQASPPAQNLPPRTPLPARQGEYPDRSFVNMVLINVTGDQGAEAQLQRKASGKGYVILLAVNYLFLFVGSVSASLLSKFYFNHKGSSRWLCTFVQSAGFPLLIPVVYLPFYLFKCTQRRPFAGFNSHLLIFSITIGFLLGINNLLFSWGTSYLPVSTSSLLLSSQLAFNLILSVIIVKTKVTFQNLNCVILLTLGSVLLALGSNHDRPAGLSKAKYFIGFFSTVGAGLMFALYLPVMEMIYKKVYCYAMVVEMQLVMEVAATGLAAAGMAADGGFMEIRRESRIRFDLGPGAYWWTVAGNLVTWQLCFLGTAGMVFLTTSVTSGICMTALMGMNVIAGVLVFGDEFGGLKVVSTLLCGWGFCSYVYGMYAKMKKEKEQAESKVKSNGGGHVHDQDHQSMDMTQNLTASGV
ncbi:probable purine permease 4 [Diospyros lotus]|uniref:probable purine permease 4 n=1 Tax=Diospyros lotus TaxID=55363 RepID=UPI0022532A2F|nr:probable purine permease 4 [Diospyros lotus]